MERFYTCAEIAKKLKVTTKHLAGFIWYHTSIIPSKYAASIGSGLSMYNYRQVKEIIKAYSKMKEEQKLYTAKFVGVNDGR
ncbi:MAG: hypothetical protein GY797_33570 [Deltaproteobacteria bacterium]|nr:hypothetical protein [Deltaproteobacteria bacterium]